MFLADRFRSFLALAALVFVAALPLPASAQQLGHTGSALIDEQRANIEGQARKADELEKKVAANDQDDARLVEIRLELEDLGRRVLGSATAFRPRLSEINSRIDQLGPLPVEGQPPEPDIVSGERQALAAEKAEINAVLGLAKSLSIRINKLVERIGEIRRELFSTLLTKRYQIDLTLIGEVADAFYVETAEFLRTVSSWMRFVVQFKLRPMLLATFFSLAAAAVLLIGGRRMFGNIFEADPTVQEPTYLSRLSVTFWSTLLPTVAVGVFLSSTYLLYDYFGVLRGDIGSLLTSLFIVIGIVFFVQRLARGVLSPRLPNWRLIPVQTRAAHLLFWLVLAMAFFTGADVFFGAVYAMTGAPLSLTVGESLIATVLTGIPIILIGFVRPFLDAEGRPRRWNPLLRLSFFLLGGVTMVAAFLGYIGFARFLSAQIVFTGALLTTMYIGFLTARAIAEEGAFAKTIPGGRLKRRFELDDAALDQIALVVSISINALVILVGVPLILFLWGFQIGDIRAWLYRLATGFQIGSFTFSPAGLLTGVLVFVTGYFLTRWFQGWLDGSVMARGRVDAGVRNSIRLATGYAGVALAGLVSISAAGIDLSNLALVAGALSLGIGFGLQNVVSNFVSGLILLAERPFKVGDWIVAGPVSGTVKKISVRATEIETFQRQSVILPNSELINSAVGNWTHRNKLGRIDIKVAVAYGADVKQAHALLLDIARAHPMVLKNPEPFVLFANFGTAALEFEIRVFVADVLNGNVVQNDIRFAVLETLDSHGIEIPSTPRWVPPAPPAKWPADDETAEARHMEQEDARAAEAEAAAGAPKRRRKRGPDPD